MADIVQSLFGLTPEAYRQQQANEASRMALGYAQLTPQQRASFGAARAGYQLGEVLGGALGGQDPMLQMISNRQAIARQIDPTNIESMTAGIQALNQAGDTVGAMQLTQVLRQMQSEMAQRTQREAAAQASLASAKASEADARRKGITDAELKAGRRAEIARLMSRAGELSAEDIQALQIENRALMSKEELEAEEAARQTRAFTGGVPAQPAMAQPMAVQPAAPAAEPVAAQPAAAQPAAPTTDIQGQLQQKLRELEFAKRFPKSVDAQATVARLNLEIQDLQLRGRQVSETQKLREKAEQDALAQNLAPGTPEFIASVNRFIAAGAPEALRAERQNNQYRSWLDQNRDVLQAPAANLSLEDQLAARQAALVRVSEQATSGSTLAKRDEDLIKSEINVLREQIKERRQVSEERNNVSREIMQGRSYNELSPAEMAKVNAEVDRRSERKSTKNIFIPGQTVQPKDWLQFKGYLQGQPTFKQTSAIISAAPTVLRIIKDSTRNDFASAALPVSIAKLLENNQLSDKDIERYANVGGLTERLAGRASRFFTGRITSVTKNEAERFMTAIYRGALIDQKNIYTNEAREAGYFDTPNFRETIKNIDAQLAKFREVGPQQPAAPVAQPAQAPRAGAPTQNRMSDEELLQLYGQPQGR